MVKKIPHTPYQVALVTRVSLIPYTLGRGAPPEFRLKYFLDRI